MKQIGCGCWRAPRPQFFLVIGVLTFYSFLAAGRAEAFDWKIETFFSEKLELDDNLLLSPTFDEVVFGTTTNGQVTATASSPTHYFTLDANLSRTFFYGLDGVYRSQPTDDRYSTTFNKTWKRWDLALGGSFSDSSTFFSQQEDIGTGIIGSGSQQESLSANGSLTHHLNQTDRLTLTGSATRSEFSSPTAITPFNNSDSYDASLAFERDVNRTLSASLTGQVAIYDPQGLGGNTRYTLTAGMDKKLSPRVDIGGTVEVLYVDPEGGVAPGPSVIGTGGSKVGFPFSFDASYTGKDFNASFGFSRSVSQNDTGFLNASDAVNVSASYLANNHVTAGISANYSVQEGGGLVGGGGELTSYNVSPTISYLITPIWSLGLGYQYRVQESGTGSENSNNVYLTLNNSYVPLP